MIVPVAEGDAVYGAVRGLSKTAKQTVGFLSDSAFAQRARQGTLFAAIDGEPQTFGIGTFDLGKSTDSPFIRSSKHGRGWDALPSRAESLTGAGS